VRSDRTILILALVSTLCAAAGLALVYDLTGVFSSHRHRSGAHLVVVTLILAFPLTFVSVFFNTAVAAAAASAIAGRRLSLREALAVPVRRIGQVALWALLATCVGVILEQLARRLPLVGSLAVRVLGLSWSVASLFAVPILATDGCSAPQCLRRSAKLIKKRWGEGISGSVTITAWAVAALLPLALIVGIAAAATRGHPGVRIVLLAFGVIALVIVMAVTGVVRETFNVVLYRYALTGGAEGGFSESDLSAPFTRGPLGARGSAAGGRPWSLGQTWPWLLAGALGTVAVLMIEINKRHYAAHHLAGRVIGAVLFWLAVTMLARFVIWIAERAIRR